MSRLTTIAADLGRLYRERAELQLREWKLQKDAEARKLFITPPEGWPGKNAEQRDAAAARVLAEDPALQAIAAEQATLKQALSATGAELDALEAERRALEWEIRDRMADALASRREHFEPADDAADVIADAELDALPF